MNKKPFFSVVIPAYNEEKSIDSCLKSVIQQNFPKPLYEVIVVDNNSTDQTPSIIKKFPVQLVREKKQGYVHALRRGVKEAKGEILVFTDADTMVPKDWITKYQKVFENREVVLAGGAGLFRPQFFYVIIAEFFNKLANRFLKLFSGFNFAMRLSTYQELGGFNPEHNFNCDTDLMLRAVKKGKIAYLPDNPVITSSRHYRGFDGFLYSFKGVINSLLLIVFKKTLFKKFGDVR